MPEIVLYHGTISDFDKIDITKGKPYKDFGCGFYTSKTKSQAIGMAKSKYESEIARMKNYKIDDIMPSMYLYTYSFDTNNLNKIKYKEFKEANKEWVNFITMNRTNEKQFHDYDIVTGPTANDKTMPTVNTFLAGTFGNVESDNAINMFLQLIKPYSLPFQFYFGTQKYVGFLKLVKKEILKYESNG
jgi:hypothetical protein